MGFVIGAVVGIPLGQMLLPLLSWKAKALIIVIGLPLVTLGAVYLANRTKEVA